MEKARRCTALEAEILNNLPKDLGDDINANNLRFFYGYEHVADRLERLGLTVVGTGDGYTFTEISKLRIFTMAQQSICLDLVFLEEALRALKESCDARLRLETEGVIRNLGLLFWGVEPLRKVGERVYTRLKELEEEVESKWWRSRRPSSVGTAYGKTFGC
ncbi:uncharacterized protein BO95DRAFT_463096 [Aspergillus brunneoviolaceus CBS 621.78]|uniref:Uncharacterized protein n=1 Tax=Aspergillus brunneoviolaceus CBS 621.78 TaxID=1450534 RepID=A0ACD1GAY2_9EURO|nr:hypothetical protein BO95DRAFT_463096 [Aspergillus brunneoviolaceus CBS 621.78]RAH46327.1 hypothetical protein BO95DRAFT_463096 [Aspergillus brunneoviolaceus CBS 621.78]